MYAEITILTSTAKVILFPFTSWILSALAPQPLLESLVEELEKHIAGD